MKYYPSLVACLAGLMMLLSADPGYANKFETIGSGVSGSVEIKREWLQGFLFLTGGVSLFLAALVVLLPRSNALFLNYRNWKSSAAVLLTMATLLITAALLI